MIFKLKPFPCPECGHFLLVDGVRAEDNSEEWTVNKVLDDTTYTDPELQRFERNAELRSMGRRALYARVINLQAKVWTLTEQAKPWWKRC